MAGSIPLRRTALVLPDFAQWRYARTPHYVSAAALKFLSTPQTGHLPTGFFQTKLGNRGANYGWASAPVFCHAARRWRKCFHPAATDTRRVGTQPWRDLVKGVAHVFDGAALQLPNSDAATSAATAFDPWQCRAQTQEDAVP